MHMLGWYAAEAVQALGFEVSPGTINSLRKADVMPGDMDYQNIEITVFCTKMAMLLGW